MSSLKLVVPSEVKSAECVTGASEEATIKTSCTLLPVLPVYSFINNALVSSTLIRYVKS